MSEKDREGLKDLLWTLGITFIIAYPIGWFAAPEQSAGAQFGFGVLFGGMAGYSIYLAFIAPWVYARRWTKKKQKMQREKEVLNAARK